MKLATWNLFQTLGIVALTLSLPLMATEKKAAPNAAESPSPAWSQKMQELSQTMSELLPEISNNKPTTSPKTIKKIQNAARKLKTLAHTIKMGADNKTGTLPPDADPSIPFLSSLFEREAKHAYAAVENGHIEYAKGSLRIVTSYCIACHTRTDQGPEFPALPLVGATSKLSRFEKAQLFAATRQFDRALKEFEALISDKAFAKDKQLEWGRAVRHAFTIAVRVKQDPKLALEVVQKVQSLKPIPPLFKEYVAAWKTSIQQWQQEKQKTFNTEAELYAEAQRLLKAATQLQKYPLDHSADVLFLRVSLVAHELLSRFPQGPHVSDALFLAGNAYDLLDDHLISPLPEMYYEACIRKSPHSDIAGQCYKKYETNVSFGYTGSGGTAIPTDLKELLKELKKLSAAQPKPAAEETTEG